MDDDGRDDEEEGDDDNEDDIGNEDGDDDDDDDDDDNNNKKKKNINNTNNERKMMKWMLRRRRRRRKMMMFRGRMLRRKTDPKTRKHTLCEPAQSKWIWACDKSHFVWKFTGKMPDAPETASIKHRALNVTVRTPQCGHTVSLFREKTQKGYNTNTNPKVCVWSQGCAHFVHV